MAPKEGAPISHMSDEESMKTRASQSQSVLNKNCKRPFSDRRRALFAAQNGAMQRQCTSTFPCRWCECLRAPHLLRRAAYLPRYAVVALYTTPYTSLAGRGGCSHRLFSEPR